MILKDLRISPLRNILTGISMFVGIIAMISSVLVGTLGKEYLISVNAQMYGWSPTYSFSITCIFRKNCASVPEERSAIPLQTEQSSAG